MPTKPLRPCLHAGCRELVSDGYCDKHKPQRKRSAAVEQYHRLYTLPIWVRRLRPMQLAKEPFCRECWQNRRQRVRATDVDHITPHCGDLSLFTDPKNLQSLCHKCHSAKTMREQNAKRFGQF